MSGVRGFDSLYQESINDIALHNYNKGIADRLRKQEIEMFSHLAFKEPKMLSGGVRASNFITPGMSIDGVPRAVGGRAFRTFTGDEKPYEGGSRIHKAYKWKSFANETANDALALAKKVASGGSRIKKAYKWKSFANETANDALALAKKVASGGSRIKKAYKWKAFANETADDALALVKKVASGGSRIKKAYKWKAFANETADDALALVKRGMSGGMVYSPSLKKALEDNCNKVGGAKPKKTGRFAKGSPEAKAWGAKMKEARMKKNK
jgi:hypothetical protein